MLFLPKHIKISIQVNEDSEDLKFLIPIKTLNHSRLTGLTEVGARSKLKENDCHVITWQGHIARSMQNSALI